MDIDHGEERAWGREAVGGKGGKWGEKWDILQTINKYLRNKNKTIMLNVNHN